MAHTKAGGSTANLRDSNPQYLGVKLFGGEIARNGAIIIRQRGSKFMPGEGTRKGKDDTIYAIRDGKVLFADKRKRHFDGTTVMRKLVSVV
ncbi:MAG: 50S ribosomal protein L27 [Candidatus Ryanbacteria bacterium]|nr:50S ribosomal protein L27 [Candidatus Ryanbacteria bacterium]